MNNNYSQMTFSEKERLLKENMENPNVYIDILHSMTYEEKKKVCSNRENITILSENKDDILKHCVHLGNESLDEYVKRNNLVPFETFVNNVLNKYD